MICIQSITLRKLVLELKEPFEISSARITHRPVFLLEVRDQSGITVWSEVVAKGLPNYFPETIETAWHIISKFIAPIVVGRSFTDPSDLIHTVNQTIRGNTMAKAGVEMAAWAIVAEQNNSSLAKHIGGTQEQIPTGISLGIQDSPEALVARVGEAVDDGYHKVKIKIKPGKDLSFLSAVRNKYPDLSIMADANSAYTLDDTALLQSMDDLDLLMFEQPLRWDDFLDQSILQRDLKTPICLDESIANIGHAKLATHLKSGRIINIKPGRVSGFTDAIAIHDHCRDVGWAVWCGGMLESGVGRAYNVALASLPHFSIPGDLSPSQRYWKEDIVDPEWTMDENGYMTVPRDRVGIGVTVKTDMIESLTEDKLVVDTRTV